MKPLFLCFILVASVLPAHAQTTTPPANEAADGTPKYGTMSTLSPQDWQELRLARQAVLKAHPEMVTKAAQLADKMHAFQEKLNAAIIKEDLKLAPFVAKMGNRPPPQHGPGSMAPPPTSH